VTTAQPETVAAWEEYLEGLDTPEKYAAAVADKSDKGWGARLTAYVDGSRPGSAWTWPSR
jgi:hypothetical protein